MKHNILKNIFDFLEEKGEHRTPFLWKWLNNEPLTEDDLHINGNLDLTFSKIESLPEGLNVSGDLNLTFCDNISSLPEGLIVRGNLSLFDSKITFLPEGLKVEGWLDISNTNLEKYTDDEIRDMIKPGFIEGKIYR
jgi:hypothetical protein